MNTQKIEKHIVDMLVIRAIGQGFSVDVNDGEETVLVKSQNVDEILAAMFSTDEERLTFHDGDRRLGWIYLVYGNGEDMISDYITNPEIDALVEDTMTLAGIES